MSGLVEKKITCLCVKNFTEKRCHFSMAFHQVHLCLLSLIAFDNNFASQNVYLIICNKTTVCFFQGSIVFEFPSRV